LRRHTLARGSKVARPGHEVCYGPLRKPSAHADALPGKRVTAGSNQCLAHGS
jgi:hypothetical protein